MKATKQEEEEQNLDEGLDCFDSFLCSSFDELKDLPQWARDHVRFLQILHLHGISTKRPPIESLRRYVDLWLPLVDKHQQKKKKDACLIPPADIAWLWHCHRLAPYRYMSYLKKTREQRRFQLNSGEKTDKNTDISLWLLEASPPFSLQLLLPFPDDDFNENHDQTTDSDISPTPKRVLVLLPQQIQLGRENEQEEGEPSFGRDSHGTGMAQKTQELWEELYPHEPFFLLEPKLQQDQEQQEQQLDESGGQASWDQTPVATQVASFAPTASTSLLLDGFDLLASSDRQATFLWQVSSPKFQEDTFLQQGLTRYQQFLFLKRKQLLSCAKQQILVPTYQIDLLWHTHMLMSLGKYHQDCIQLLRGGVLPHDDSLNDRTPGGTLDVSYQQTKQLWKDTFGGEDYHVPGGMYRGEPPMEYWKTAPIIATETPLLSSQLPSREQQTMSRVGSHRQQQQLHNAMTMMMQNMTLATTKWDPMIDRQGATSTSMDYTKTTAAEDDHDPNIGGDNKTNGDDGHNVVDKVIWCWKETPNRMGMHSASQRLNYNSAAEGDDNDNQDNIGVDDCWIRYEKAANLALEKAFQSQEGLGKLSFPEDILKGYVVDFSSMKQTKVATGYQRDVQRVIQTWEANVAGAPMGGVSPPRASTSKKRGRKGHHHHSKDQERRSSKKKGTKGHHRPSKEQEGRTSKKKCNEGHHHRSKDEEGRYSDNNDDGDDSVGKITWCWKEDTVTLASQVHPSSSIIVANTNCWIKYDSLNNDILEMVYQIQGGTGECTINTQQSGQDTEYQVSFDTRTQTNVATGHERDVQRLVGANVEEKIWCWRGGYSDVTKLQQQMIAKNPALLVVGDHSSSNSDNCWIPYDIAANDEIEKTYQRYTGVNGGTRNRQDKCTPMHGYTVEFATMTQLNNATNYRRPIQRMNRSEVPPFCSPPKQWTPLRGFAPDGKPAYVKANPKGRRLLTSNPKKDGYIFGNGPSGLGYYHFTTREAYEILHERIKMRVVREKANLDERLLYYYICFLCFKAKPACITIQEEALEDLQLTQQVIAARKDASVPFGVVGLPTDSQQLQTSSDPKARRRQQQVNQYYSPRGDWHFPHAYDAGGGCGTCGVDAGGCGGDGGGGCGGAGCGGAGCGGGGCGGCGG